METVDDYIALSLMLLPLEANLEAAAHTLEGSLLTLGICALTEGALKSGDHAVTSTVVLSTKHASCQGQMYLKIVYDSPRHQDVNTSFAENV